MEASRWGMGRGRRGQSGPLFAAGVFALAMLAVLTLSRFRPQGGNASAALRNIDLTDERAAMDGSEKKAKDLAALHALKEAEQRGLGGASAAAERLRPGRQAIAFGTRGSSAIFGGRGGWSPTRGEGEAGDDSDLVASEDVVVRLLGTPDGDFIFHRKHGWMNHRGDKWEPIPFDQLPPELCRLYPYLGRGKDAALGDAGFDRPDWMKRDAE